MLNPSCAGLAATLLARRCLVKTFLVMLIGNGKNLVAASPDGRKVLMLCPEANTYT